LVLACLALLFLPLHVRAASGAERRAFATAQTLFNDHAWDVAEQKFAEFVKGFPNSDRREEAVMLQAQARFRLTNYVGVIELLQSQLAFAGPLADEYRFWLGEAYYQSRQYQLAAEAYAMVRRENAKSHRRLEASYGEAYCRYQRGEYDRVKKILGDPDGDFQQLTRNKPDDDMTVQGYLLLGRTLLEQKDFKAGEQALASLNAARLKPELAWRRQYLLCRMQLADDRPDEALKGATNLVAYAEAAEQKSLLADSVALQAGIHEKLGQLEAAVAVYERNLVDFASPEQRRQALLKVIELTLAQGKIPLTIQKLEDFATKFPRDPAQDLAQLTLGELKLKQHFTQIGITDTNLLAGGTNLLPAALGHFDRLVTDFSESTNVGRAYLERGWCHWLLGNYENSQPSFRQAVERLPVSLDQAVARFKLGDTYIWQKDYTNALVQFNLIITNYVRVKEVRGDLLDQALYQVLRANIAITNLDGAREAFHRIVDGSKGGFNYYSDRSMQLWGQFLNRVSRPADAREVFAALVRSFPNSTLAAEAELAMARTFVQERQWEQAIAEYNAWAENDRARRSLPEADFDRAWVHYMAGQETNALRLFTQFTTDFPTNTLAPQAQFWVASYFFRRGDFTNAEANFQSLFIKSQWPSNDLAWQARMMAGRAAFARLNTKDASDYFLGLINDDNCPTNIFLEACFAQGDTLVETPATDPAQTVKKFNNAIVILGYIPQKAPASPMVPAAWGRMGDYYLQLAALDPKYYTNVMEFYQKAMTNNAEVAVRSQAEVGLGLALEKQAELAATSQREELLTQAYKHYANVLYGLNLNLEEKADPTWLKNAALAAIRIKEAQGDLPTVEILYQRLKAWLPALADFADGKIKAVRERMGGKTSP
jgi:TolA-binding protein